MSFLILWNITILAYLFQAIDFWLYYDETFKSNCITHLDITPVKKIYSQQQYAAIILIHKLKFRIMASSCHIYISAGLKFVYA